MEEDEIQFDSSKYSDIEPTNCPPPPICSINYSPLFKEIMSIYRTLLKNNEYSQRALDLTTILIQLNSADYSAWFYRRNIIKNLSNYDLKNEYEFIDQLGDSVVKNYQVWGHRQFLVSKTQNFLEELKFTDEMLEDDNKNYHCWSHRVWICEHFDCWINEIEYTAKMIEMDVRNNSAWSHRFFGMKKLNFINESEMMKEEMKFVEKTLKQSSNNESVWTYLTGLYEQTGNEEVKKNIEEFVMKIVEQRPFCTYSKICFVSLFKHHEKTIEIVNELKDRLDMAHASYWDWYLKQLK